MRNIRLIMFSASNIRLYAYGYAISENIFIISFKAILFFHVMKREKKMNSRDNDICIF